MKVLLGLAPYTFQDTYPNDMNRVSMKKGFGLIQGPTPSLGLLYIAAVLKKHNHTVSYFEGAFYSREDLKQRIACELPDLLGFLVTAPFWDSTKAIIQSVKQQFPSLRIIIGGPHVTLVQEQLLEECPEVDFACFGEGEHLMVELLDAIAGKENDLTSIEGLIWRNNTRIIKNRARGYIKNLDDLPFPDFSLVEFHRYAPSIGQYLRLPNATMIGSRGCLHNCLFCNSSNTPLRRRSIHNIISEIEFLIDTYGIKDVLFYDEDMSVDKVMLDQLCERIIEKRLSFTWSGNARVDNVAAFEEKLLRKMKKSGCWKLLFGLESGVQKNLDILRKRFTLEQSKVAIAKTVKAGIKPFCMFMFGIPTETYDEGIKTIDFACTLKGIEFAKFLIFTPFPGMSVYNEIDKYGKLVGPMSKMTMNNITFVPSSMSKEAMEALYYKALRRFYRRPEYILRRLIYISSWNELCQNVRGFKAFVLAKSGSDMRELIL